MNQESMLMGLRNSRFSTTTFSVAKLYKLLRKKRSQTQTTKIKLVRTSNLQMQNNRVTAVSFSKQLRKLKWKA